MKRLLLLAPLVCLSLATACDDGEAARAAERRDQELAARLADLEAQIEELEKMLAAKEARPAKPKPMTVTAELDAGGLRLEGEAIDLSRLEVLLRERLAKQPELGFSVAAAADVDQARVLEVLDLARSVGVVKVGIVTDKPQR